MGSHLGDAVCPWEVGFRDAPSVVFQLCSLRGVPHLFHSLQQCHS